MRHIHMEPTQRQRLVNGSEGMCIVHRARLVRASVSIGKDLMEKCCWVVKSIKRSRESLIWQHEISARLAPPREPRAWTFRFGICLKMVISSRIARTSLTKLDKPTDHLANSHDLTRSCFFASRTIVLNSSRASNRWGMSGSRISIAVQIYGRRPERPFEAELSIPRE